MNRLDRLKPFWPARTGTSEIGTASPSDSPDAFEDTFHRMIDQAESVIVKHPKVAMAVAVSIGLALGWMVKRR